MVSRISYRIFGGRGETIIGWCEWGSGKNCNVNNIIFISSAMYIAGLHIEEGGRKLGFPPPRICHLLKYKI